MAPLISGLNWSFRAPEMREKNVWDNKGTAQDSKHSRDLKEKFDFAPNIMEGTVYDLTLNLKKKKKPVFKHIGYELIPTTADQPSCRQQN